MESSVKTIVNVSKEKRPDHFFSDFNMSFFDKTRSFYSVTLHINRSNCSGLRISTSKKTPKSLKKEQKKTADILKKTTQLGCC